MIRFLTIPYIGYYNITNLWEELVRWFPPRRISRTGNYLPRVITQNRMGSFHNNIIFDDDLPIGFIMLGSMNSITKNTSLPDATLLWVELFALEHLCEVSKTAPLCWSRTPGRSGKHRISTPTPRIYTQPGKRLLPTPYKERGNFCLCISRYTATWMQKKDYEGMNINTQQYRGDSLQGQRIKKTKDRRNIL